MVENAPTTAGPNGDGSQSLARESRAGLLVQFVLSVVVTGALGWLADLDLSTLPGWAASAGALAVTSLIGAGTAYLKKNR